MEDAQVGWRWGPLVLPLDVCVDVCVWVRGAREKDGRRTAGPCVPDELLDAADGCLWVELHCAPATRDEEECEGRLGCLRDGVWVGLGDGCRDWVDWDWAVWDWDGVWDGVCVVVHVDAGRGSAGRG